MQTFETIVEEQPSGKLEPRERVQDRFPARGFEPRSEFILFGACKKVEWAVKRSSGGAADQAFESEVSVLSVVDDGLKNGAQLAALENVEKRATGGAIFCRVLHADTDEA